MTKASYFTLQNHISDFHHRLLGRTKPQQAEACATWMPFQTCRGQVFGITGSSRYGCRALSPCKVVRPAKMFAGRSAASSCSRGHPARAAVIALGVASEAGAATLTTRRLEPSSAAKAFRHRDWRRGAAAPAGP